MASSNCPSTTTAGSNSAIHSVTFLISGGCCCSNIFRFVPPLLLNGGFVFRTGKECISYPTASFRKHLIAQVAAFDRIYDAYFWAPSVRSCAAAPHGRDDRHGRALEACMWRGSQSGAARESSRQLTLCGRRGLYRQLHTTGNNRKGASSVYVQ